MLIFDTETTGLIKPTAPLNEQPRIIELGVIKVNKQLEELERFQTLLNPDVPLPEIITKITGLADADLAGAPKFIRVLPQLIKLFAGEDEVVAHNVSFDMNMLINELHRVGWEYRFPYPWVWTDTVPLSGGKKLEAWSKELLGDEYAPQSHRAIGDAERLLACYRAYRN